MTATKRENVKAGESRGRIYSCSGQRMKLGDLLQPPIHTYLLRIQALREIKQPLLPDDWLLSHHCEGINLGRSTYGRPGPRSLGGSGRAAALQPALETTRRTNGGMRSLFFVTMRNAESRRSGPIPHY